jgi:hypothetical protein
MGMEKKVKKKQIDISEWKKEGVGGGKMAKLICYFTLHCLYYPRNVVNLLPSLIH